MKLLMTASVRANKSQKTLLGCRFKFALTLGRKFLNRWAQRGIAALTHLRYTGILILTEESCARVYG